MRSARTWSAAATRCGGMVAVLMVQRLYDPIVANLNADFWTLAYQAIDD